MDESKLKNSILRPGTELPDKIVSNEFKGLKVLGLVADRSACGYYRVINPLHMLKMHGAQVTTTSIQNIGDFLNHDIIIAPRQHSEDVYEVLRMMKWQGKRVIFEIDDDLSSVLPSSPAYISYHPGSPELARMAKIIKHSDGFTTTTPEIAKWYYQYNQNPAIIENYIDLSFRDWGYDVSWYSGKPIITEKPIMKPDKWNGKKVVAWSGGSCYDDQTEVLTEHGFKLFKHLMPQEKVASFNPETQQFEYHEPTQYFEVSFKGDLICAMNNKIDFAVTPNHFLYVKEYEDEKYVLQQAEDCTHLQYWVKNQELENVQIKFEDQYVKEYDGTVYCVTVPHHILCVRRNGKTLLAGNTHAEDLQEIGPDIRRILNERDDVIFAMYSAEEMYQSMVKKYNWPIEKTDFIPPRHFVDHPSGLHGIDIGLAPIICCQFNLSKCVVGDVRLHTPDKSYKIKDLYEGRNTDTFYELSNLLVETQDGYKKATHFYYGGKVDTLKIKTYNGYELEASLTHRIKNAEDKWVFVKDLKINDKIKLSSFHFSKKYQSIPYNWTCTRKDSKIFTPENTSSLPLIKIDEIWGELLGFILGDGHVGKTGLLSVCCCDEDITKRVEYLFNRVGLSPTIVRAKNRDMWYVNCNSKPMASFLLNLGFSSNKKLDRDILQIPEVIWSSPRSVVSKFLSALFESDGTVSKTHSGITISSCSEYLIKDIQKILLGFNIISKTCTRMVKYQLGEKQASTLSIGSVASRIFCKEIGFLSSRKMERLLDRCSKPPSNNTNLNLLEDYIVEIEISEAEVFDITVPENEQWIGDGFIQHNSHLKMTESLAVGAVPVASNVGPYARFHKRHPGYSLLVGNGDSCHSTWYSAITSLLDDPDKLAQMKQQGRQLIMDEYSLEKNFRLWPIAWKAIIDRSDKGLAGPPKTVLHQSKYKTYGSIGRNDPCLCQSGKKAKNCCGNAWG